MLLFSIPAFAQLPTGTILGTVKDPSGAVVPGASVTIQNIETGNTRAATTSDDGAYRIPALPVGHYTVKVEKNGFKTQTQQGLVLDVSQELVVNATLQVGASEQEVVVTSEAPLVNTTSATLGGLVNENKMADLPLNGRNYIDLSLMQAGVAQAKNIGTGGGMAGTWYSSNGAPMRSNTYTIDGASMVNQLGGSTSNEAGTTLGVDGIREYKVVTNSFSAEYGGTMGSQMLAVSKSGSNGYHGDVFEFLRNSALDARNYFDAINLNGRRLPEFQRNNFGGSAGGPIRKDKTFFYGVYEGLRQNLGVTTFDQVPGAGCHGPAGAVITAANCPELAAGTSATVAPVMAPILALFPNPNLPGDNFTYAATARTGVDFGQMRVDHNFSAADSFFARYTVDNSTVDNPNASITQSGTGSAYPQFKILAHTRNQFLTLSENHIFSPSLLNTARVSYSRTMYDTGNVYLANLMGPQYSFVPGLPIGSITFGSVISTFGPNTTYGPPNIYHGQNIYTISDDLFYTRGRHALKFGTLMNRYDQSMQLALSSGGAISFQDVKNFLQGTPQSWNSLTPGSNLNRFFTYYTFGFYAQDDWRVSSRLTLNLGLRYESNTTPTELNGLDYAIHNIATDTAATPGGVLYGNNPSLHNFSPRLGFAYDVTGRGKTAIRGGFGLYYDVGNIGGALEQQPLGLPPLSSRSTHTATPGQVVTLPLPFTAAEAGKQLMTTNYYAGQPKSLQYNLTVEQQLPLNLGLSVSYVGLRGMDLWTILEGNPRLPSGTLNGRDFWANSSASANKLPRINPAWQNASYVTTVADSWYNSLQVVVNRRLAKGLEAQSSYTWGKSLDDTQGQMFSTDCTASGGGEGVDALKLSTVDKGPSCFDVKHNWRFNLMYHFPNINSHNFLARLEHGWWLGNIVSVQSGYAFTPILNTQRSFSGNLGTKADRVDVNSAASIAANPCTAANPCRYTPVPYDASQVITGDPNQWFNPAMFALGPVGTLGNASRDMLRGPGLRMWDFSVVKDTGVPLLGEQGRVQFRAEMFNVLNHTNFGMPNGVAFSGATSDAGPFSEGAIKNAGKIVTTSTTSRQIQLSLKLIF